MKNKLLGLFIILAMIILIIPSNVFASGYTGIDTNITIGGDTDGDGSLEDEAIYSSVGITNRIVGVLQVAGTIIAVISLIIIGMRYMFSSVQEKAQMKGVIGYWIIGAILVLCTSNVLAFIYDIVDDVQHTYEDVPASEGGIKLAPTCVATGIQLRKCKDCGKTIEATIPTVPPDEFHQGDVYLKYNYTAETCTTEGLKVWTCTLGCPYYDDEIVGKLGHKFEFVVINRPTCTKGGEQGNKCKICGYEKDKSGLAATGHTEVTDKAVAPTCTETGKTEGSHCSVCDEILTVQNTISAKGHTEVDIAAAPATCTKTGKTEGKKCSVCNTVTLAPNTVPAKGHDMITDIEIAATCTTAGKSSGSHCSRCNYKTGTATISALGHNWEEKGTTAATCVALGSKNFSCKRCSQTKKEDIAINSTNHKNKNYYYFKQEGFALQKNSWHVRVQICNDCGAQLERISDAKKLMCSFSKSGNVKCTICDIKRGDRQEHREITLNGDRKCCYVDLWVNTATSGKGYNHKVICKENKH